MQRLVTSNTENREVPAYGRHIFSFAAIQTSVHHSGPNLRLQEQKKSIYQYKSQLSL